MLPKYFNKSFLLVINSLIYLHRINCNQICKTIMPIRYCFSVSQCRDISGLAGHLDCVNKECCCANGSEFKSSHGCYWRKYLGAECKYTADCVVENSICQNEKCECPTNKILRSGKCQAPKHRYLGDKCNDDEECSVIQNAICTANNTCDCPDKQIFKSGICQEPEPDTLITQYKNCLENETVLFKGKCERFEKCGDNETFYDDTCETVSKLCVKNRYILQEDCNYNKPVCNNDIALTFNELDKKNIETSTTAASSTTTIASNRIPNNGCTCTVNLNKALFLSALQMAAINMLAS